jgi:acetyl esterase
MIPDLVRDAIKGTLLDDLLLAGLSEFSPINAVSASSPPFLLIHGTEDSVVPLAQSQRFCDKLQSSGVNCELYTVKGGGHGVRGWESMRLTDYKSAMVAWLDRLLTAR